jgi:hypothetical protein
MTQQASDGNTPLDPYDDDEQTTLRYGRSLELPLKSYGDDEEVTQPIKR